MMWVDELLLNNGCSPKEITIMLNKLNNITSQLTTVESQIKSCISNIETIKAQIESFEFKDKIVPTLSPNNDDRFTATNPLWQIDGEDVLNDAYIKMAQEIQVHNEGIVYLKNSLSLQESNLYDLTNRTDEVEVIIKGCKVTMVIDATMENRADVVDAMEAGEPVKLALDEDTDTWFIPQESWVDADYGYLSVLPKPNFSNRA